jgi:gas vesicle protein
MSDNDNSSFVTGLILGTIVGLAIGFLYAPQPGAETRKLLKEKAEIARHKAAEAAEIAKHKAAEAAEKAKQAAAQATKKLKTAS